MVDLDWKTFDPVTLQQARSNDQLILLLITVKSTRLIVLIGIRMAAINGDSLPVTA